MNTAAAAAAAKTGGCRIAGKGGIGYGDGANLVADAATVCRIITREGGIGEGDGAVIVKYSATKGACRISRKCGI